MKAPSKLGTSPGVAPDSSFAGRNCDKPVVTARAAGIAAAPPVKNAAAAGAAMCFSVSRPKRSQLTDRRSVQGTVADFGTEAFVFL